MIDLKKQFYVISYSDYYPQGGLNDVKGSFDTLQQAKEACTNHSIKISDYNCIIWDRLSAEIVFDLYNQRAKATP
jgi:hypothetical protein